MPELAIMIENGQDSCFLETQVSASNVVDPLSVELDVFELGRVWLLQRLVGVVGHGGDNRSSKWLKRKLFRRTVLERL